MQGDLLDKGRFYLLTACVLAGAAATSQAAIITGWGAETGNANGTVTDDGGGAFHTTAPTGNLAPRALMGSPITLANDGDGVRFSGTITTGSQVNGNDSLRFALVNTNGMTTGTLAAGAWTGANPNGWLGYIAEVGNISNNTGSYNVIGRLTGNTGGWFSGTGSYSLGTPATGGSVAGGSSIFNFNISIQRLTSTSLRVGYNFIQQNGTYSNSAAFTDTGSGNGGAVSTMTFNAVGFLQNTSSGGASSFSNLDVSTFVPEPATLASALGAASLTLSRRRKAVAR